VIRRLGALRPSLQRGVLSSEHPASPLALLEDTGADTLWQERGFVDRALVETLHRDRRRVVVWTVDRADEIQQLAALGVDGVCTNLPDVARRAVGAREVTPSAFRPRSC
jgi:glycerophosphoryl diester phosphodiesterase